MGHFKAYIWLSCQADMDAMSWEDKFRQAKENGLHGVFLSKSASNEIISAAKKAGLEAHTWLMIMCRPDVFREIDKPEWFMVNR
ncbi:MAG: hypothetical protein JXR56_06605, partial [Candidatus Cloacimonetes bacterium]|nr:hypothetical protein [Candidatus Cloacimonadota bacterium]